MGLGRERMRPVCLKVVTHVLCPEDVIEAAFLLGKETF